MSRNIGKTYCPQCYGEPMLIGAAHLIHEHEANGYYAEYKNLLVANAECDFCGARFLAWLKLNGVRYVITDLSYRSTFNDEPGWDDCPNKMTTYSTRAFESERCHKALDGVGIPDGPLAIRVLIAVRKITRLEE